MRRLPDPCLVVLVGPSASGKSAWAADHFAAGQVVSSDALRALAGEGAHDLAASADAFELLDAAVAARLRRRLTTVVDTLGLEPERRGRWRELAARVGLPAVLVCFDTPPAECRRRNAARRHRVPAPVLAGQIAGYAAQRPTFGDEGWTEILAPTPVRLVSPEVAAAARSTGSASSARSSEVGGPAHRADGGELRFGLHLPAWDVPGGAPALRLALRDVAARAEAAGLHSMWVMDHLRQVPQVGRAFHDMLESVATLGYLAAVTERVELGCLVHGVTLRNVGVLGKSLATLDVLSGGRIWCGLGAGWYAVEQAAYGLAFPPPSERLDLLEEALRALPLLWGPGAPAYDGRLVSLPEALGYPRPLRGRIPLLVGGQGPRRTLALVARYADACNLFGDAAAVRRSLDVLRRHCAEVGRDPAEIEVTHLSTALVAADPAALAHEVDTRAPPRGRTAWTARVNAGTVDDHVLRVRALRDAGVQHVITSLVGVWDSPALEVWGRVVADASAPARPGPP